MSRLALVIGLLAGVLAGVQPFASAQDQKDEGKGDGKPLAKYRAEQKGKKVTVFATGENPTAGWKNELAVLPIDVYPPAFKFTQAKPDGIVAQVVTPFAVEKSAPAPEKVEHVFVTDATGKHKVAVAQAK